MRPTPLVAGLACILFASAAPAAEIVVKSAPVEDRKAVIATVEPVRQLVARARIGGTIDSLNVQEGDEVAAGAEIAIVVDHKLLLQIQALGSAHPLAAARSATRREVDFDRIEELQAPRRLLAGPARPGAHRARRRRAHARGHAGRAQRHRAADRRKARCSSPGAGRVLTVPVSVGRVVLPGETIATLAEDQLHPAPALPERHAQIMHAGDAVQIGAAPASVDLQRQAEEALAHGPGAPRLSRNPGRAASSPTSRSRGWATISSANEPGSMSRPASASAIVVPAGCRLSPRRRSASCG